ncbi:MAG TPA: biotin--[acetyl-CoA-carboxylase] ligase [Terracidiphilus sp.]|nr:biotin--[acetyl-CoA-carboxylase] ligase [Terracidiphilus sp.]
MYELAALEAALQGTTYAGNLHFSAVTGSTNSDALAAAREGAPHGSVFFADAQTAGRGRGDHHWESAVGAGLYVSVVLRLPLASARAALLPLAAGLAAVEAIREASGLGADLRWPNDLLIGARKTGGILVESKLKEGMLEFAVAGIGINVHQRAFAPDLATPATSLDLESLRPTSRQALLIALLESLEREAAALLEPAATAALLGRVERASTWIHGRAVEVHGPQECVGVTAGLDENGFLLVQTADELVTVRTGGIRAKTG